MAASCTGQAQSLGAAPGAGQAAASGACEACEACEACGVCETCGAVSERADHTYGDWQKVSEATESEKGTWKRVCSVCGYVQYGETPVVEPDDAEIPQTGDATNATLPVLLAVSGIAVAIGVIVFRRRSGL